MKRRDLVLVSTAALALAPIRTLQAQTPTPSTPPNTTPTTTPSTPPGAAPAATASTGAASGSQPFTAAQLDQLLAPIALYPDDLLAQTLMAASYPLEVVEAARWSKDNPNLKGDAAVAAVKDKGWDVSVTSLVAFPQVLAMMNNKLDWTQKIGDAMIAQQSDVAASIQRLRAQAQAAGNLKSTPQQKVTHAAGERRRTGGHAARDRDRADQSGHGLRAGLQSDLGLRVVALSRLSAVLLPAADYGWGGYYGGGGWSSGFSFGVGVAVGGALFGGWSWGGGWGGGWGWRGWGGWGHNSYTTVNVNRATYITNNFNRNYYHDGHWNHDPAHRDGVPYRDQASRERYGQHRLDAAQRQAFRGQLDQGTGDHRDDGNRGTEGRGNNDRGGENRGNENHGNDNRGNEQTGVTRIAATKAGATDCAATTGAATKIMAASIAALSTASTTAMRCIAKPTAATPTRTMPAIIPEGRRRAGGGGHGGGHGGRR